mmetsp:Transcript_33934/g.97715  ORF Transcript_33934/g.97715 Transcript_33934/m.97715 type:complete len:270 (+) Transcript_33934:896-1705(+)
MSTSRAPKSLAIFTPSPVVCGPNVVGKPSRSGRFCSRRLSASLASCPKPPEAMIAEYASKSVSVPLTIAFARQPAPPCSRPVHFDFRRRRKCPGLSEAHLVSSCPAANVTSAPTKAFAGRSVRLTVCPPSCDRMERSTVILFLSQSTADAESFASRWMRSGLAKAPALLVVSAMSDSTEVSKAALMPELALPELPPKYGCFSIMMTFAPRSMSDMVATMPAKPPPITIASAGFCGVPSNAGARGATATPEEAAAASAAMAAKSSGRSAA